MPRTKVYQNDYERLKAWRQKKREEKLKLLQEQQKNNQVFEQRLKALAEKYGHKTVQSIGQKSETFPSLSDSIGQKEDRS